MLSLSRQAIELDQRQFDLLMAAIAALLAGLRAEGLAHMLDIALQNVEQPASARRQEIGDAALEQMAEIVEFVVVAQIGPALVRLALQVPAIEIAVRRLRLFEVVDDPLDLGFDIGVAPVRQRVGRRLDPFADVGIPEHLDGEIVLVARKAQRRRRDSAGSAIPKCRACRAGRAGWGSFASARSPAARARTGPPARHRRTEPA